MERTERIFLSSISLSFATNGEGSIRLVISVASISRSKGTVTILLSTLVVTVFHLLRSREIFSRSTSATINFSLEKSKGTRSEITDPFSAIML